MVIRAWARRLALFHCKTNQSTNGGTIPTAWLRLRRLPNQLVRNLRPCTFWASDHGKSNSKLKDFMKICVFRNVAAPVKARADFSSSPLFRRSICFLFTSLLLSAARRAAPVISSVKVKGAEEKLVLAWWLRERTAVTLRWVSERLRRRHYTRITQAISRMRRTAG